MTSSVRDGVKRWRIAFLGEPASSAENPLPWLLGIRYQLLDRRIALYVLAVAFLGVVYQNYQLSMRSEVVPYVVEVGRSGVPRVLEPSAGDASLQRLVEASAIAELVVRLRTLSSDEFEQAARFRQAFRFLAGDAERYVDGYFRQPSQDPRLLSRELVRTVDVQSVLPSEEEGWWRVEWQEYTQPREAIGRLDSSDWVGTIRVERRDVEKISGWDQNPFGIYFTTLNWRREGAPERR